MTTLSQASHQWATRPSDERFTSLDTMLQHFGQIRNESREVTVASRRIHALPDADNKGLQITGPNGHAYAPTNWSFGQLAALAEAPAGYLRTLPSPVAADCINYGLQFKRQIEDVGVLLQKNGEHVLRAATGPRYGRIWNNDVVGALVSKFGNGIDGDWRVPGEFGKRITVTKENTTLFASDRDMFVFLADEDHRIEIPNRRNGQSGSLARGFFVWNSEVGDKTFGLGTFLFDYACSNRIVWGAEQYSEIKIRHTASAPDKFLQELAPALKSYANATTDGIVKVIEDARAARIATTSNDVNDFIAARFGKRLVPVFQKTHELEEGRPIETLWDLGTAATAYARSVANTDDRVVIERKAGEVINSASK